MKVGDTYVIPADGISHPNHTATVIAVSRFSGSYDEQTEPDIVTVHCECGQQWSWEDRGET